MRGRQNASAAIVLAATVICAKSCEAEAPMLCAGMADIGYIVALRGRIIVVVSSLVPSSACLAHRRRRLWGVSCVGKLRVSSRHRASGR